MVAPSRATASAPMTLHADVEDFKRLFEKSSQVDVTLRAALRRNIRKAAAVVVVDVQRTVLLPPVQQAASPHHKGLREGIARGIKVAVMTGNSRIGVSIQSKGYLGRAYNKRPGWRHPVFGNSNVWVTQTGQPGHFTDAVPRHQPQITDAVRAAMQEAADSLKGT